MIGQRLKEERKRLGLNQDDFAAIAGVTRRPYAEWESSNTSPTGAQLAQMGAAGADVQYIVTGVRRGDGIGESAVHQAVLDAVDLLSLGKKVDGQQLAAAVLKLISRSTPPTSPMNQQSVMGGSAQQFNAPIHGGVAMGEIIYKTKGKSE